MTIVALIPFFALAVCFVGLRLSLVYSSFIALLISSLLTGTLYHATPDVWETSLLKTFEILVEIGLIILGAFFFIETARETKTIDSLSKLVQAVTPNRLAQALLVTFPLELMIEGSSGFGTPLLIIAPILLSLGFPMELCAVLPLLTYVIGVPFGALGTPIRLAFTDVNRISLETVSATIPFLFIGPAAAVFYLRKLDRAHASPFRLKHAVFMLLLSVSFYEVSRFSAAHGPEFPALSAGFFTFAIGILALPAFFEDSRPLFSVLRGNSRGLFTYALLILCLWVGKQVFLDRLITGTHIRLFNPGFVFILFAFGLHFFFHEGELSDLVRNTLVRSKRVLLFFFCMTFLVQQLRNNGALHDLTLSLPSFLLREGAGFLGWIGSIFIGTSTVTNLLLSPVVDPSFHRLLTAGSAIGIQVGFQTLIAMHSILQLYRKSDTDGVVVPSEARLLQLLAPLSLGFIVILFFVEILRSNWI